MTRFFNGIIVFCALVCGVSISQAQIANTPHNLSATGPGALKATGTTDICVFCHTPHNAAPSRALWNRDLPPTTYRLYQSSTLEAQIKQPTGASRLCLSCHDGTTALGALRVKPDGAGTALGPLTGKASLGTDLSDDHPVSFVYDAALSSRQGQLVDPRALPSQIRLDETRQLQCTACHEPHSSSYRRFLRMDDRYGALCTACHNPRNWSRSAHANSPATGTGTGTKPWASNSYGSVAENGCENCHQTHAAPHPQRLLANAQETKVCLTCHDGSVAVKYLEGEFFKFSAHPIFATNWIHEDKEGPNTMVRHVTCTDCHNPHQASAIPAAPPLVPGPLDGVSGITISGGTISKANYEYEVCLKCHGIRDQTTRGIVRQDNVRNIRLKISLSNPSFHPVAATGKNATMGGFEAGYSTASIISCTDCHNNDAWTPGGTQPRGSHGSLYSPILAANYQANDPSTESFQNYALCYKCHNRNFLIHDSAGTFLHQLHVVQNGSPCAACHDAHGSRQHIGLINFMLRDRTGRTVVSPSRRLKRLEFISDGPGTGSGSCTLSCHGLDHRDFRYCRGAIC
jgi:predicted CXXCH cytochrome family protein